MLKKFEDWLFWKLDKRWRDKATVDDIIRHREWLVLDIHVKKGKTPLDLIREARELLDLFSIRLEGSLLSQKTDVRVIEFLKRIASLSR